ncbi:MAG: hypothetical protein WEB37_10760 [Bacteroidota bacterium]
MKVEFPLSCKRLCAVLLIVSGCRDTGMVNVNSKLEGFRIEGTVLDGLEQPFNNIPVSLFYSLEFIDNTVPVRDYTIQTPGESVNVDVYDYENGPVRNLYAGTPGGPTIYIPWDQRENNGVLVGSGVYTIRVTVGGGLRHSYVETVNGRVTAQTDANGVFVIPGVHLPVGFSPAPVYNSGGAFTGNYRVMDRVLLEFSVGGITHAYSARLVTGQVTRVFVRII